MTLRLPRALAPLALLALLATTAAAQAPYLEVPSPDPSALGYTGDFGDAVDGLGDAAGVVPGDLLVGAPWEPESTRYGRAYLLDGTTGALLWTFTSPHPNLQARFGDAVSRLPDVTGDGLDDVLVGAGKEDYLFNNSGRAYAWSRPAGGLPGVPQLLLDLVSPNPELTGEFGAAVEGLADLTGDGRGEVLVGAPRETVGGKGGAGRAYLFDGVTGALLRTFSSPAPGAQRGFGHALAGVPDVDGDGVTDLAISEPELQAAWPSGSVHLFSGATGVLLYSLDESVQFQHESRNYGVAVEGLADLDGDGRGEVLVGANHAKGAVWVYSGASGALLRVLEGKAGQGNFGSSLARVGDADGDGLEDFLVGAPGEFHEVDGAGRAYAVRGGPVLSILSVLEAPDPTPLGFPSAYNNLGRAVAGLPDADGDGRPEYLVGAPGLDPTPGAGAVQVFYCPIEVGAAAAVRLGSPPNPAALTTAAPPVVGSAWSAVIDTAGFQPAALLHLLLVDATPANVPSPYGTLLVSLGPSALVLTRPPGQPFLLPVPADCALVGATVSAQGVAFDGATFAGTSALDLTVGTH